LAEKELEISIQGELLKKRWHSERKPVKRPTGSTTKEDGTRVVNSVVVQSVKDIISQNFIRISM